MVMYVQRIAVLGAETGSIADHLENTAEFRLGFFSLALRADHPSDVMPCHQRVTMGGAKYPASGFEYLFPLGLSPRQVVLLSQRIGEIVARVKGIRMLRPQQSAPLLEDVKKLGLGLREPAEKLQCESPVIP